jgi:hypothetical protein
VSRSGTPLVLGDKISAGISGSLRSDSHDSVESIGEGSPSSSIGSFRNLSAAQKARLIDSVPSGEESEGTDDESSVGRAPRSSTSMKHSARAIVTSSATGQPTTLSVQPPASSPVGATPTSSPLPQQPQQQQPPRNSRQQSLNLLSEKLMHGAKLT